MSHGINGIRRDLTRLKSSSICRSCRAQLHRRHASTAPSPLASQDPSTPASQPSQQAIPPVTAEAPNTAWTVRAGVLLSRPPQITRELTPFEKAFFLYQRRLNERTAMPFPRYFYIPKATPQDVDWKRKLKVRKTPARDIGNWSAWDRTENWNDELLVGSSVSEPQEHVRKLLEDALVTEDGGDGGQIKKVEKQAVERPASRLTEADESGDTRSLKRALARTLYLLVKGQDGRWRFPSGLLEGRESLARAAERILVQAGGINMNTWMVGNAPIGYQTWKFKEAEKDEELGVERLGEKTFFMKARIMAGKASLKDNPLGITDHQWLTRDELQKTVPLGYWSAVKNMLPDL